MSPPLRQYVKAVKVMTAKKALIIVVLWGVTFASIGGVIGATLGKVAPSYYRSIFRDGHLPHFIPLQVNLCHEMIWGRIVLADGNLAISPGPLSNGSRLVDGLRARSRHASTSRCYGQNLFRYRIQASLRAQNRTIDSAGLAMAFATTHPLDHSLVGCSCTLHVAELPLKVHPFRAPRAWLTHPTSQTARLPVFHPNRLFP